jgi:hypothetical protein
MFILAFAFIGIADPVKYFVFFANNPKQHEAFNANLKEVSNYIRLLPASTEKYIVTGSMERLTIKYLNPTLTNTYYLYPEQVDSISPASKNNFIVIFTGSDWENINNARDKFPNIAFEEHRNTFNDVFYTLKY